MHDALDTVWRHAWVLLGGSLLVAGVVAALYAACAHLDRLLAGASEIIESVLSGYSDLEEAADEQRADDDDGTDYGAAFWEVDISGRWTRYEDSISHTLETAYGVGQVGSKRYVHDGVAFTANLNRMVALRDDGGSHGDHRPIRRRVPRAGWIEPAYELAPDVLVHECFAEDVDDPAYEGSEEVVHLRGAIERYSQLMRGHAYAGVKQVDVYDSRSTREAFEGARRRFEGGGFTAEQWVFHTVSDEPALRSLMCNGFQVGGADGGVAMAGSDGVYVADGPSTPRHRRNVPASIGQEKIVLARVLLGRTQSRSLMRPATETGPLDSWRPRDDWVVFRQSDQLLPIYVLHF